MKSLKLELVNIILSDVTQTYDKCPHNTSYLQFPSVNPQIRVYRNKKSKSRYERRNSREETQKDERSTKRKMSKMGGQERIGKVIQWKGGKVKSY